VLLVEDDRDTREMYQLSLEHEGFSVTTVKDGAAALQAARRKRPDVVVTDLTLPRLNGHDLCRQLRADPSTRDLALVLLTGHALVDDGSTFDRVLLKPCLPDALAAVIRELVARPARSS
jgi:CheY-like chemotaxis protein